MRTCPYCGLEKEERFFPPFGQPGVARHPTGWALACRACQRRHGRIVRVVAARYGTVLVAQEGLCKACRRPATEEPLQIDVDYRAWLFRGLVHRRCNNVIGIMEDSPELLRRLAHYLEHAFDGRVRQPTLEESP